MNNTDTTAAATAPVKTGRRAQRSRARATTPEVEASATEAQADVQASAADVQVEAQAPADDVQPAVAAEAASADLTADEASDEAVDTHSDLAEAYIKARDEAHKANAVREMLGDQIKAIKNAGGVVECGLGEINIRPQHKNRIVAEDFLREFGLEALLRVVTVSPTEARKLAEDGELDSKKVAAITERYVHCQALHVKLTDS